MCTFSRQITWETCHPQQGFAFIFNHGTTKQKISIRRNSGELIIFSHRYHFFSILYIFYIFSLFLFFFYENKLDIEISLYIRALRSIVVCLVKLNFIYMMVSLSFILVFFILSLKSKELLYKVKINFFNMIPAYF